MITTNNNGTLIFDKGAILRRAWEIARENAGVCKVRKYFSMALMYAWDEAKAALKKATHVVTPNEAIQSLKTTIMRYTNSFYGSKSDVADLGWALGNSGETFAAQVCESVAKYRKCSEKQAFIIAKAAIATGMNVTGMFN